MTTDPTAAYEVVREALEGYQRVDDAATKFMLGFAATEADYDHNSPARRALAALTALKPAPADVQISNDRVRINGKWFYAPVEPALKPTPQPIVGTRPHNDKDYYMAPAPVDSSAGEPTAAVAGGANHTPDGRPIFGEGSPHDVGEHLARLAVQPDEYSRFAAFCKNESLTPGNDSLFWKIWQVASASKRESAPATITVLKQAREVFEMLSKRQIATWYSRPEGPTAGYYAGWDDAEYDIKQALTTITEELKRLGEV